MALFHVTRKVEITPQARAQVYSILRGWGYSPEDAVHHGVMVCELLTQFLLDLGGLPSWAKEVRPGVFGWKYCHELAVFASVHYGPGGMFGPSIIRVKGFRERRRRRTPPPPCHHLVADYAI